MALKVKDIVKHQHRTIPPYEFVKSTTTFYNPHKPSSPPRKERKVPMWGFSNKD